MKTTNDIILFGNTAKAFSGADWLVISYDGSNKTVHILTTPQFFDYVNGSDLFDTCGVMETGESHKTADGQLIIKLC